MGDLCLFHILLRSSLCPFKLCSHLDGEDRAGCFTLFVFLVSCDCNGSVDILHDAVGWSAVCDCGIF